MDFEKLIERCISEMNAKNLTNKDLAEISKISEATVSRALTGKGQNITVATLAAICNALGVTADAPAASGSEAVYLARIADLKERIRYQATWIKVLFTAFAIVVAFVLTVLAIDIANPSVGWFRSALGITAKLWGHIL